MNLDQLEDMIRRYLSAGIAVVVVLVAPLAGGEAGAPDTAAPGSVQAERSGNGEIDIIDVGPSRTPGEPVAPGPDDPGADDGSPSADPAPEDGADGREADRGTGSDDAGETTTGGDTSDDTSGETPDTTETPDTPDTTESAESTEDAESTGDATATGPDVPEGTAEPGADRDEPPAGDADGDRPAGTEQEAPPTTGDRPVPDAEDLAPSDGDLGDRGPADADEPGVTDEATPGDDAGDPAGAEPSTGDAPPPAGEGAAAERYGWGAPVQEDDFTSAELDGWTVYGGTGYDGRGSRSADAVTVRDGVLTITGDARGTTGGMCWGGGQRYGRWEARVRAPEADPSYHALLLLWPDADDAPTGGEIDFMELQDPSRRSADFYLHFGEDDDQMRSRARVDATEWHDWAVEWTPEAIVGYLDGEEWFRSTDPDTFPPGPMHLCVQLDWFPEGTGQVRESRMEVDRVRQYVVEGDGTGGTAVGPASAGGGVLERMFSWG